MRPPEEEIRRLVAEWVRKADLDFELVAHLSTQGERFRDAIAFHAHQAVEKYLKALLTRVQIEFPKTHLIARLLILLQQMEPALAEVIGEANWLGPFGVDIRYPGDSPETLPGDEVRARQLAQKVRDAVMAKLGPYLSGG